MPPPEREGSRQAILRALLHESRDALLALDESGTVLEANDAAASTLGHESRQLVGTSLATLIAPADRRRFRAALDRLEAGRPEQLELRLAPQDAPRTLSLRVIPRVRRRTVAVSILGDSSLEHLLVRFPTAVVALEDGLTVTFANSRACALLGDDAVRPGGPFGAPAELRSLAVRLLTVQAPLPPRVVRAGDRLLRASGLAATGGEPAVLFLDDASAEVRHELVMADFVRNAAHQLRTPLAGITAAIQILQAGAKERPADRDRFLGHLETHTGRLTRLTRALLDLARAQHGERLRTDVVELAPLLDEVASVVEPRPGVNVIVDCDPGLAALAAHGLLHETLAALVGNAVDLTEQGDVRVAAAAADHLIALTVADSGPGIPPALRERVFEPFFRVADDTRGYGLGLAIAAEAVEAMGGTIEVSGGERGGTIFTVTLPAAEVSR